MRYKSYGMPRILLTVFALVVALAAVAPLGRFAWAQGGETLTYGSNIVGSTTAEIPYAIYAINMNEGDTISLLVAGLTPDMLPSVSMVGPTRIRWPSAKPIRLARPEVTGPGSITGPVRRAAIPSS